MKIDFDKKENNTVSFSLEVEPKEFKQALTKAYKENRKYFSIPGFRKGKAPKQIIELNYGKEVFYEDAINLLLPEKYEAAVKELELEPVDQPVVDIEEIKENEAIVVKFSVDVKPEVKLGDYKGLEVEEIETEVTEEMLQHRLNDIREQNARLVDGADKEIEEGNIANIDFKGYINDEAFEGGEGEAFDLTIGSNMFIPGFEEQLIGKKKDDEVKVEVKFPEEYHVEEFAGQEAIFEVKINSVRIKELPELDDDFALDVSDFDTIEEYKEDLKKSMKEELEETAKVQRENTLVEKAVENSEFSIPDGMVNSEVEKELGQIDYRLRSQGLDLETYLQLTNGNVEDLKEQIKPVAEKRVAANLVLEAIAEAEKIEVSDDEIDEELAKMAEEFKAEDKESFIKEMKKQGDLVLLKESIVNKKVVEILINNAK